MAQELELLVVMGRTVLEDQKWKVCTRGLGLAGGLGMHYLQPLAPNPASRPAPSVQMAERLSIRLQIHALIA